MGIVIAVILLLGVIALVDHRLKNNFVGFVLVGGGLWNGLWYGLRHIGSFWGNASIITGVLMVLAAIQIMGVVKLKQGTNKLLVLGLAGGFLLYAVTLIQINLGYPFIK